MIEAESKCKKSVGLQHRNISRFVTCNEMCAVISAYLKQKNGIIKSTIIIFKTAAKTKPQHNNLISTMQNTRRPATNYQN